MDFFGDATTAEGGDINTLMVESSVRATNSVSAILHGNVIVVGNFIVCDYSCYFEMQCSPIKCKTGWLSKFYKFERIYIFSP